MRQAKAVQISASIRLCFDLLDTYGLTPQQLKHRNRHLIEGLIDYDLDAVRDAFGTWADENSKIPTLADIKAVIARNSKGCADGFISAEHKVALPAPKVDIEQRKRVGDKMTALKKAMLTGDFSELEGAE